MSDETTGPPTMVETLGELRERIAWLEARIAPRGHRGYETERDRLVRIAAAMRRVAEALDAMVRASEPEIDAETGATARMVPGVAWHRFLVAVGIRSRR